MDEVPGQLLVKLAGSTPRLLRSTAGCPDRWMASQPIRQPDSLLISDAAKQSTAQPASQPASKPWPRMAGWHIVQCRGQHFKANHYQSEAPPEGDKFSFGFLPGGGQICFDRLRGKRYTCVHGRWAAIAQECHWLAAAVLQK